MSRGSIHVTVNAGQVAPKGRLDAALDGHTTSEKLLLLVELGQGDLRNRDIAHASAPLELIDELDPDSASVTIDHRLLAGGRGEFFGNDLDLPDPRRLVWLAGILARVLHGDVPCSCGYGEGLKGSHMEGSLDAAAPRRAMSGKSLE